jgi:molybdenum-dependent DNA-binding transcriptional regulator ModE
MTVSVAVAEEESFAAGARRLGMSPPAVTRAISALEDRLGVKLLNRTTRYVRVTDAGHRYLDDARRIIGELDEADEAAAGVAAEIKLTRGLWVQVSTGAFGFGHRRARLWVAKFFDLSLDGRQVGVPGFFEHVPLQCRQGLALGAEADAFVIRQFIRQRFDLEIFAGNLGGRCLLSLFEQCPDQFRHLTFYSRIKVQLVKVSKGFHGLYFTMKSLLKPCYYRMLWGF